MASAASSRGPVARLLYGFADSEIALGTDSLTVGGAEIPLASLSALIAREDGRIWSRATLQTPSGTRTLRGFPRESLASVVETANTRLIQGLQSRYSHLDSEIEAVVRAIEQLSQGQDYVRHSQYAQVLTRAQQLLAIRKDDLWRKFASPYQRTGVARITLFLEVADGAVAQLNAAFVERELAAYSEFFDTVESMPLTDAQRRACVIAEDNNLVLAGAGTGKTSVMIGRAGYLIASGRARPEEILMLAYGRKAAGEMQERQDSRLGGMLKTETPTIKTFHALGLEIIGKAEGRRPDLSPMAEDQLQFTKFVDEAIASQCEEEEYRYKLVRYCGTERFPYRNWFDFATEAEYLEYVRVNELRTLRGEVVKSFEEVFIANYLASQGVRYEYERPYEVDTSGPDYRQYRPDFYLPDYGVYIEHFALDRNGRPPEYFNRVRYLEGVRWKRELHAEHGTRLIETFSYLKREDALESTLAQALTDAGVEFSPQSANELLAQLRGTSQVTDFALLVTSFIDLMKQSALGFPELRQRAAGSVDASRINLLLDLVAPVFLTYEATLAERSEIDFADMILRATGHVESGSFESPYTHILVDEFQDISPTRARLIQALARQRSEAMTFVVGDDWQSIYRFTGSDLRFTTRFAELFGPTATTTLDLTFRFNNMLSDAAARFVLKNPEQLRKTLSSVRTGTESAVSLVAASTVRSGLGAALQAIDLRVGCSSDRRITVLVLGRFTFTYSEFADAEYLRDLRSLHPNLDVEFMTAHGSKGKEADYVVVLDVSQGRYGFPSEKPAEPVLEFLLPEPEPFRFAEERRLFYVAVTRARQRSYVVYDPQKPSSFVTELLEESDSSLVSVDECGGGGSGPVPNHECPRCKTGTLVIRRGEHGSFVGCSHYPYCTHTEAACASCGGIMRRVPGERICVDSACGKRVRVCPRCGGDLVMRSGRYGRFIGCSNYSKRAFGCTYKEKA